MTYDEVAGLIAGGQVREWALDVLGDIAAGRTGVTAVRHPLGFLCLPLERAGGDGVCVHIWSQRIRSARVTTSPVHCHSWELVSHVLYGRVANVHISVIDETPDPTHRVFEVVSAADWDVIQPTERTVRYATVREERFGPGQTYWRRPVSYQPRPGGRRGRHGGARPADSRSPRPVARPDHHSPAPGPS
ncbi:hypothetical protein TBS_04650 [Thermobispora bispora]|jgi:hypothetical protein|uniref:hypothetical protein n=1 Tax=Thermobispora bispora TaxID=2006 RepID=UPI00197CDB88|nr:hypothetical protein [Thermobispora bispora]